jgi:hypothetical protein
MCPRSWLRVLALAVPMLLSTAAACKAPGSPQLQGKWRGTRAEGIAADKQADANTFAAGIELDVKGDQITVTYPKEQRQTGRYTVLKQDKTTLVIATDKDGPDARETFTFLDDKTMKWAVLDGKTITFSKQP